MRGPMSSFVINLAIPLLVALAVRIFAPTDCVKWIWVAVVPDLDYFIPGVHRGLTHNLLILGLLGGLTAWAYRRVRPRLGDAPVWTFLQGRWGAGWVLSTFYYFAHILLDVFAGGIAPFYPFTQWSIALNFRILVDTETNEPSLHSSAPTQSTLPQVSPVFEWLSNEETAIAILTVGAFLLSVWARARRRPVQRVATRAVPPRLPPELYPKK